jgi:membrane protein
MQALRHLPKLLWKTALDALDKDCIGYAKEAAYSFILSFFPMLIFGVAAFARFGRDNMHDILETLRRILPPNSYSLIESYLTQLFQGDPTSLLWISFLVLLLPATGLVATISRALDRIYCIAPRRSFWREQGMSLGLVFVIGVPLLFATVAATIGAAIERVITRWSQGRVTFGSAWVAGRWGVIFATVFLIMVLLLRIAPSRAPRWGHILPGAVLGTFLWIVSTLGFGYYVTNFASYNRIYGSIGAGVVLLIWMYFTALVFLIGAVFNRQYALLEAELTHVPPVSPFEDVADSPLLADPPACDLEPTETNLR